MMPLSFQHWLTAQQQRVEAVLDRILSHHSSHHRLQEVMRYAALGGGKRIRPLLVLAVGEMVQAPIVTVEKAAAAIELIHVYSLIHDDLPAMDNDTLRRGKPTSHIQYGEAQAILAGDALQTRAFETLSMPEPGSSPVQQLKRVQLLSEAAGANGMCGGQMLDLEAVGRELSLAELEMMHIMKTGALIRAAVLIGAYCAEEVATEDVNKLDHFAKCIGLAFQIVDDILDQEGSTDGLGKTSGKDGQYHKPTYVSLLGLSAARTKAEELYEEALSSIAHFGKQAQRLYELADFIIKRRY